MDLRDLIAACKGPLSYAALSEATIGADPAHPGVPAVKPSRLAQLGVDPLVNLPDTVTMLGLAQALDVTHGAVLNAAGVSVGLDLDHSPLADLMPRGADGLPPEAVAAIRHVVREMVRIYRAAPRIAS